MDELKKIFYLYSNNKDHVDVFTLKRLLNYIDLDPNLTEKYNQEKYSVNDVNKIIDKELDDNIVYPIDEIQSNISKILDAETTSHLIKSIQDKASIKEIVDKIENIK
jgi:hypothetical protein